MVGICPPSPCKTAGCACWPMHCMWRRPRWLLEEMRRFKGTCDTPRWLIAFYSCLYVVICVLYVFICFRQRNLGSRQALARLSLAKQKVFNMCLYVLYRFEIGLYIFLYRFLYVDHMFLYLFYVCYMFLYVLKYVFICFYRTGQTDCVICLSLSLSLWKDCVVPWQGIYSYIGTI